MPDQRADHTQHPPTPEAPDRAASRSAAGRADAGTQRAADRAGRSAAGRADAGTERAADRAGRSAAELAAADRAATCVAGRSAADPADAGTQPSAAKPAEPSAPATARRSGARPLWTVILLLVLGAAVLWLASRLTWAWSRQLTPLRGTVVVTQRGSEVAAALIPLAFLALAAVAAILAIGGWWRRLVGVLVGIAGLAAVWVGVRGLPGVFAAHPNGYPLSQVVTGHALAVVAGVLIVAAAVLVVRNAAGMPRLGGNYQTPSAARRRRDPDTELWQALSEGRDPTANE